MNIYEQWIEASARLKEAKAEELRLRNAICDTHLEDKLEGSKTDRFGDLKITTTARLNRSIDTEVLDAIWDDLTLEEQDCVIYKPSLVLANYKRIEQSGGKLLEAVTVKPGQASLKIVEEFADEID